MLGKFFLMDVEHSALTQEMNQPGVSPLFRSRGFLFYLAEALRLFEKQPSLVSIKLICGVTPEVNKEVNIDIRLRHHVSLIATGGDVGLNSTSEQEDFVMRTLPYHTLGAGVFEICRESAAVQEYFALRDGIAEDERRYKSLISELAEDMDGALTGIHIYHDLGYRSLNG